jgi:membrane complex biogenesis BtpA family protein
VPEVAFPAAFWTVQGPPASLRAMTPDETMAAMFGARRALIGMIHAGAMPGTPAASAGIDELCASAVAEARVYRDAGFTALILENMHDTPYLKGGVGPEVTAAIAREVAREVKLPLGIQVLAAANEEALAVALASGAGFVRVEGFAFGHVADEGWIEASAGPLLRYRRAIGAEHVKVFADVKKKHAAHAVTADVDLADTARAAEFFRADGVIVTGSSTGRAAERADVECVAAAVSVPVLVGSGLTPENLAAYAAADGFIVGSSVKQGGVWSNALDRTRVEAMAKAFAGLPR